MAPPSPNEVRKNDDRPLVTADCVVFDEADRLLLIRRKNPPYQGHLALPGGFVEMDETVETAALRELREETGIVATDQRLVGVYSDPARDTRGRIITVAYLMEVTGQRPMAQDDAASAAFMSDWQGQPLAFDHAQIIADALALKARKS